MPKQKKNRRQAHTGAKPKKDAGAGPSNAAVPVSAPVKSNHHQKKHEDTGAKPKQPKNDGGAGPSPKTPKNTGSDSPKVDPVTFFTETYFVPQILDKILNLTGTNVRDPKDYYLKNIHMTTEEFAKYVDRLTEMRFKDNCAFYDKGDLKKAVKAVGEETVKRCLRVNALALEALKLGVKRPAAFAVSKTWRAFMIDRARRGLEEIFDIQSKMAEARREVLGGKKPTLAKFPSPCIPCRKVFLMLVGSDDARLHKWFGEEMDFCGLHWPEVHEEISLLMKVMRMKDMGALPKDFDVYGDN